MQGFSASVSLSVSGLPAGATGTFFPVTIVGGNGSSTLTVTTTSAIATGLFPFTITASTPGLSHSTSPNLLIGAPDFTGSISPKFQAVAPGGSGQYTLSLKTIGTQPFGSLVTPTVSGLPAGVAANFSPPSINPDSGGSSVLTLTTSTTTPQGTFNPVVTAAANGQSHGDYITLAVSNAATTGDFSGTFNNTAATALPGSPATYSLTLTPSGGFSGNVALGVSGLPDDTVASFSPSLVAGGSGGSVLSVSVSSTTPKGIYTINVIATSGGTLSHTTTLTLLVGVVDFTGFLYPLFQDIAQGTAAQYTVQLSTLGTAPFGGTVVLYMSNLPPGVTASFNPATISPDSQGSSVLTLTTSASTPIGSYQPILVATGGGITHARNVGLKLGITFIPAGNSGNAGGTATTLDNGEVLIGSELYDPATGTFATTGGLTTQTSGATATLLKNGMVLLTGGTDPGTNTTSAQLYDPTTGTFSPTGSMHTARRLYSATRLNNGKVLIVAGLGGPDGVLRSSELYDPVTGTFSDTGSLTHARSYHTATLLNNGMVLIAGGIDSSNDYTTAFAEVYDPATGSFFETGSLNTRRYQHTATLLNNGMVLIAGGSTPPPIPYDASAELYNQATGTFTYTGSLDTGRWGHAATLLSNGLVLVSGGNGLDGVLNTAELYDSTTGTFSFLGVLTTPRAGHTSTLLNNGAVLLVGGSATDSAELYVPLVLTPPNLVSIAVTPAAVTLSPGTTQQFIATGTFSDSSTQQLTSVTWSSSDTTTATVSNDVTNPGTAIVVGSPTAPTPVTITATDGNISGSATLTARPAGFVFAGNLNEARWYHSSTLLNNGLVLVAGGSNSTGYLSSAQLYNPATGTFTATGDLNFARAYQTATLLTNGMVLIAGGADSDGNATASAELYNPATGTFTVTGSLNNPRYLHTATILSNGMVLIVGGADGPSVAYYASAELYNPATGTFTNTGSLNFARWGHTETLLSNGLVLIAGGYNAGASAELYNPATGTFTSTGNLNLARENHTATLLSNGSVLMAGGDGALSSAELYNPVTATFTLTGNLNTAREAHAATLLGNGLVLIGGGATAFSSSTYIASAELYDPTTGTFTPTGSLNVARAYPTATLLSSGVVLVVGGFTSSMGESAELY
jgi:hypothetical protein